MERSIAACIAIVVLAAGCTSMTTTILNRDEFDGFSRNSRHPSKGIPVTLSVPTHLNVWIEEEYYIIKTKGETGIVTQAYYADPPIRSVRTSFDFTEKLFIVDFKRPGAGTLQTDISLDPATQYFNQIHGKVVDNTIREITSIVSQFGPVLGITTNAGVQFQNKLMTQVRTLAYRRFDIDEVDFEQKLEAYFYEQVNACHDCNGFKATLPVSVASDADAGTIMSVNSGTFSLRHSTDDDAPSGVDRLDATFSLPEGSASGS